MRTERRCTSRSPAIRISRLLAAVLCIALFSARARAAEHAAEPAAIAGAPAYVRFDPIFIPIIQGDQVTRQVGIMLMLQLVEGQNKADVEAKRQLLNDAFLRDLYSFFQNRAAASGRIDQPYLKARLLKVAGQVVGPNLVKEVLIEQLFVRGK